MCIIIMFFSMVIFMAFRKLLIIIYYIKNYTCKPTHICVWDLPLVEGCDCCVWCHLGMIST